MRRIRGVVAAVTFAVAVGGTVASCSSSSKSGAQGGGATVTGQVSGTQTQATQSQSPTVAASPSQTATGSFTSVPGSPLAASVSVTGTTVATNLDPCQLVTKAEASALAGTTYASGAEQTSGNSKECVYGAQTTNVFTVEVVQADSAATAQAAWASAKAQADAALKHQLPAGMTLNINTAGVPGIGDQAATVYMSTSLGGQLVGLSGIYVLKGATFFAFQDLVLGHAPPTLAAMEAQAKTVLGRI